MFFFLFHRLPIRNDFDESSSLWHSAKISIHDKPQTVRFGDEIRINVEIGQQAHGWHGTPCLVIPPIILKKYVYIQKMLTKKTEYFYNSTIALKIVNHSQI